MVRIEIVSARGKYDVLYFDGEFSRTLGSFPSPVAARAEARRASWQIESGGVIPVINRVPEEAAGLTGHDWRQSYASPYP